MDASAPCRRILVLGLLLPLLAGAGLCCGTKAGGDEDAGNDQVASTAPPLPERFHFPSAERMPGPSAGWFPHNNVDEARKFFYHLGPLGVRALGHDKAWGDFAAFREIWPEALTDDEGNLTTNCFEVLHVYDDGPSAGELRKGDLIVEVAGQALRSAADCQPGVDYNGKLYRNLCVHFGELIDAAEGSEDGTLALSVLRDGERVDVTIELPCYGSFAKDFPAGCDKSRAVVDLSIAFLLAHQKADGSWPRLWSYTTDVFDTSYCGLALLATGEAKYLPNIRKAAYYVAEKGNDLNKPIVLATQLIFLAEYYLRTKDADILPAVQWFTDRVDSCLLFEYASGHAFHSHCYGGGGFSPGTVHVAMALAVASKTPVRVNHSHIRGCLDHLDRIAKEGAVPYGRVSTRKDGNASFRTGAAVVAARIYGARQEFYDKTLNYLESELGRTDVVHSTCTLGDIWANLALALSDRDAFHRNLELFKWKITLGRTPATGFAQSGFPLDYQGAEGVMGPWIRTASWVTVLCADRRAIAITGHPDYQATQAATPKPLVDGWEYAVYRYHRLNCGVVADLLGPDRAPESLRETCNELGAMTEGEGLFDRAFDVLVREYPGICREIYELEDVSVEDRADAIEILLGMDLQVRIRDTKEGGDNTGEHVVELTTFFPFRERYRYREVPAEPWEPLPLRGTLTVIDDGNILDKKAEFQFDSSTGVNWEDSSRRQRITVTSGQQQTFVLPCRVSYTLGDMEIAYERTLVFNKKVETRPGNDINQRKVTLRGEVVRDVAGAELVTRLRSGLIVKSWLMGPGGHVGWHDEKLGMRAPRRDCMLHQGDLIEFNYSPTDIHSRYTDYVTVLKTPLREVKPVGITATGSADAEVHPPQHVLDGDPETLWLAQKQDDGEQPRVLEIDFGREVEISDFELYGKDNWWEWGTYVVRAKVGDEWRIVHKGPARAARLYTSIRTQHLRFEMGTEDRISDIRFYHHPQRDVEFRSTAN